MSSAAAAGGGGGGSEAAVAVNVERLEVLRLKKRGSANIQRNAGELLAAVADEVVRIPGAQFSAHIVEEDGELQLSGDPRILYAARQIAKRMGWKPAVAFTNAVHIQNYYPMPSMNNLYRSVPLPTPPTGTGLMRKLQELRYQSNAEEYREKVKEAAAAAAALSARLPPRVNWRNMRSHSNRTVRNRRPNAGPAPLGKHTAIATALGIPPEEVARREEVGRQTRKRVAPHMNAAAARTLAAALNAEEAAMRNYFSSRSLREIEAAIEAARKAAANKK